MTIKPTKQQVVEALAGKTYISDEGVRLIADILVRAGLAEEPRAVGLYPYRAACHNDESLYPAAYWDGSRWYAMGLTSILTKPPAIIGPRILPPQD